MDLGSVQVYLQLYRALVPNKMTVFILVKWDDFIGPKLTMIYPSDFNASFSLEDIASQLFDVSIGLYGQNKFQNSSDVLLNMENRSIDGYIYFDGIVNHNFRGGIQSFMLGLISPKIHYLASLRIKDIFQKIADRIKLGQDPDIEKYWSQISFLL